MIEIKECPICMGELQPYATQVMSAPFFTVDMGIDFNVCAFVTYSLCTTCGAYVQSPRMDADDITKYYAEGMYREWLNLAQETLDRDEKFRAIVDAKLLRTLLDPITSHLDIGSSRGYFLQEMNAEQQDGMELNQSYAPAHVFETTDQIVDKYDLVSAIHMLEHTIDPLATLRFMASHSRKYVVVEVPSDKSPGGWGRLAHTFHFPSETLQYMASQSGLKIRAIIHTPHLLVIMEKTDGIPVAV